jgi:TonB family protein
MIPHDRLSHMKNISALFIVLFCISVYSNHSAGATPIQKETLEQLISTADEAIKNNKYKDAKKKLQQALKINKESADAHLLMALVYRHDNNRKEAIKHIYQSLQTQPNSGQAHYLMAVLLYETTETAQAGVELDKAIQLGINVFNAYTLKARIELSDRNYKTAIENYEKALQLNSSDTQQVEYIRSQTEALKNYVAFQERKDKASYTRPKPLNRPRPNYSNDARNNGVQGIVRLSSLVDEAGNVKSALLYNRLGYGLDEEAIKAVAMMKFQPATKDGKPVPFWVLLEVQFNLR